MEVTSLYRTYRPQVWADLVGQEWIRETLTNEIRRETLAHAYLFTGPRGVGKTTSARLLAKALNCEQRKKGEADPCNACASCEEIRAGRSLDVFEIDAASHTGVDNVRENIIAASRVAPVGNKKKVFIIDEVHMLSASAFNALLKTLEEPPKNVFFVLATTEIDRVPETIISRCQRFDFRRVAPHIIAKRLAMIVKKENVIVDSGILDEIARNAEGGMRDAESVLGQLLSFGKKQVTWEEARVFLPKGDRVRAQAFLSACLAHDAPEAFSVLRGFLETGGDVTVFVQDCIESARLSLAYALGVRDAEERLVMHADAASLTTLLRRLLELVPHVARARAPELPLELLIAEYAGEETTPVVKDVPRHDHDVPTNGGGATLKAERSTQKKEKKSAPAPNKTEKRDISSATNISTIQGRWDDVLAAAKQHNHSLTLILKGAVPLQWEDGVLTLGFRHSFHAERLEERVHADTACRVLEAVYGVPVTLRCTIVAREEEGVSPKQEGAMPDALLHTVLETFGGNVVGS